MWHFRNNRSKVLKIKGLLLAIDIEKTFDSGDLQFLINVVKPFGFEKNLVRWIKILLKNQESCIINGGIAIKYFDLERGTRQRDPISAYLFTLVLEVVFAVIKSNQNINKLRFSEHDFCILHTPMTPFTFFVKNQTSVIEFLKIFGNFSKIFSLKPNKSKCEVGGIVLWKG